MAITIHRATETDARAAALVVRSSFTTLAAIDWEPSACEFFLGESSEAAIREKIAIAAFAAGAFDGDRMVGFVLMPKPTLLGMLFVEPDSLRQGVARALWEHARAYIEAHHSDVTTVELNSTPYALKFYVSVGFVPISREFNRGGCRAIRMACWLPARALAAECAPDSSKAPPRPSP